MSSLDLTQEERAWVAQVAAASKSQPRRRWFYAAALLPALAFGGYGMLRGDAVALGVGFVALLLFTWWHIAAELKVVPVFTSLCVKIDAWVRNNGA